MGGFLEQLQEHIDNVACIGNKIENGEVYMEELRTYLPTLNQMIMDIFRMTQNPDIALELDQTFLVQVLNDILYGIEHQDSVFLLDVLRYGLLEVYAYIGFELQGGGVK